MVPGLRQAYEIESVQMKIAHVSDSHQRPELVTRFGQSKADMLIISGDCMMEKNNDWTVPKDIQAEWQSRWMEDQAPTWVKAFAGRPVLIVRGNHDYTRYAPALRALGAEVYCFDDEDEDPTIAHDILGLRFAGFRQGPAINGYFARGWEAGEDTIAFLMKKVMQADPDVLVTHAPPKHILDEGWGSLAIWESLRFNEHRISHHFFGHVHSRRGTKQIGNTLFVNGACTFREFEIPLIEEDV